MALTAARSQVAAAIKDIQDCPESVKQLLLTALPSSFGPDLHPYQKETGAMVRKSLEQARASAGEAQVVANQRVTEAQTVLEALQADKERTSSEEESARSLLGEKSTELEATQAAVASEEKLCEEAKQSLAAVEVERQKHEAAKAEVESVQNGSFRMLLDGGWEDEEVRDVCIDGVCTYLSNEGADAVLLAALPKALGRRPTEYGVFDKIAVDEALKVINEKVAASTSKLAEGEEQYQDVKAEHMGACAILDLAREKVQAATEVRDKADEALSNATVDSKLALSKVLDQQTVVEGVQADAATATARVEQFEAALGALSHLERGEEPSKEEDKENAMVVDAQPNAKTMDVDMVQTPAVQA